MAKSDLMQKREMLFAQQMMMFKDGIGQYAVTLGLTPEQVAAQAADAYYYNYIVTSHNIVQQHALGWTALKKSIRRGKSSGDPTPPPPFELPPLVTPVAPGVERRFRKLVRQIKLHANYTLVIGVRLGIEATDRPAPDSATIQPKFTAIVNGGHVELGWDWQGFRAYLDLCEFQVNRNDGHGFGPLTHSVQPVCKDETPFPAAPTVWQYRAIYHADGKRIGQWSHVVSVTVPQ